MRRFADIVGQEQLREHLENAVRTGKVSHAYIINGLIMSEYIRKSGHILTPPDACTLLFSQCGLAFASLRLAHGFSPYVSRQTDADLRASTTPHLFVAFRIAQCFRVHCITLISVFE